MLLLLLCEVDTLFVLKYETWNSREKRSARINSRTSNRYCVNEQNIVRQQCASPFSYTWNSIFTWMMLRMDFFLSTLQIESNQIGNKIGCWSEIERNGVCWSEGEIVIKLNDFMCCVCLNFHSIWISLASRYLVLSIFHIHSYAYAHIHLLWTAERSNNSNITHKLLL